MGSNCQTNLEMVSARRIGRLVQQRIEKKPQCTTFVNCERDKLDVRDSVSSWFLLVSLIARVPRVPLIPPVPLFSQVSRAPRE